MVSIEDNKKVIKMLESLKKKIGTGIIHYDTMTSWNRNTCEGYNDGLLAVIKLIDVKIKSETKKIEKHERT